MISRAPILLLIVLASCGEDAPTGPPQLRLGRDECAECGMLIAEDRCSAATLISVDGATEHRLWDDIGCMIDWEQDGGATDVRERWVHDHETREWVRAADATFVVSESILTPMASGMVAFADPARAESARSRFGGVVVSFVDLGAIREAHIRSRRNRGTSEPHEASTGGPSPAPPDGK